MRAMLDLGAVDYKVKAGYVGLGRMCKLLLLCGSSSTYVVWQTCLCLYSPVCAALPDKQTTEAIIAKQYDYCCWSPAPRL